METGSKALLGHEGRVLFLTMVSSLAALLLKQVRQKFPTMTGWLCQVLWGWNTLFMLTQKMARKEDKSQVHPACTLAAVLGRLFQMWLGTVTENFLPYSPYQRKHLFYYKDIQISWKKKKLCFWQIPNIKNTGCSRFGWIKLFLSIAIRC